MAGLLNFPTSPNIGDIYSIGGNSWQWNGYAWIKYSPLTISTSTQSTSTNTGALVVAGGVGISGSINIENTSTIAGAEIVTTATLAQYSPKTIITAGTDTAVSTSTGNITIWNTSTLQSVTSRGNTTDQSISISNATTATSVGTGALIVSGGISAGGDLYLGGTIYSGGVPVITTSSFISSFNSGVDIFVTATVGIVTGTVSVTISNTSTLQTVTSRGATTTNIVTFANTADAYSSSTGAVVVAGGLGVGGRIYCESLIIADAVFDSGEVVVNTTSTTQIDQYDINVFRTAKYLVQISEGSGPGAQFESMELLLVVDNNGNVYATEYGVISSDGDMGQFSADCQGDNKVRLYFTAYNATNKVIKILRTAMEM